MMSYFLALLACQTQDSSWDSLPTNNPLPSPETEGVEDVENMDSGVEEAIEEPIEDTVCPAGMVAIPTNNPQYCIMQCEAAVEEGALISQLGTIPKSNTSFYQAQEFCSQEMVGDRAMRMPLYHEWLDAADGTLGNGGYVYPWGNSEHQGECILPSQDVEWETFLECGHLDSCVSPFRVFDQLGNLWEWVDSGHVVDIAQWLSARESEGISFTIDNGALNLVDGSLEEALIVFLVGLPSSTFSVEDGNLYLNLDTPFRDDLPEHGYMMPTIISGIATANDMLPVRLVFEPGRSKARIFVEDNRDGEPIAGKVGGAFYSGANVQLSNIFWGHVPAFNGSVGFRCVIDLD